MNTVVIDSKIENGLPENLNKKLDEFTHFIEHFIAAKLNAAQDKTVDDSGLVLAIDGQYGAGKSYFLRYFSDYLNLLLKDSHGLNVFSGEFITEGKKITSYSQNLPIPYYKIDTLQSRKENLAKKFRIIKYNAWKNDQFSDPFISLVGQTIDQCSSINELELKSFKDSFTSILKTTGKAALSLTHLESLGEASIEIINNFTKKELDACLEEYVRLSDSEENFKKALTNLDGEETIKIYLIDELDRCRPDFALSFLERVKHFFNVKNCVFIVAVNIVELSKMVSKLYGVSGEIYLSRFFDFTPNIESFYDPEFLSKLFKKFYGENIPVYISKLLKMFKICPREQIKIARILKEISRFRQISIGNDKFDKVYALLSIIKVLYPGAFKLWISYKPSSSRYGQLGTPNFYSGNSEVLLKMLDIPLEPYLMLEEEFREAIKVLILILMYKNYPDEWPGINEAATKLFPNKINFSAAYEVIYLVSAL